MQGQLNMRAILHLILTRIISVTRNLSQGEAMKQLNQLLSSGLSLRAINWQLWLRMNLSVVGIIYPQAKKLLFVQLTKLDRNKVLRSRSHAVMFVVSFANSFANFKSCTSSRNPSGDAWCLILKCMLEPRLLGKILLFWITLTTNFTKSAIPLSMQWCTCSDQDSLEFYIW